MKKRTYRYTDELTDDFAGTNIKTKPTPPDYKYVRRNPIWLFFEFVIYRIIVMPLVFLISKVRYGTRIKNKKVLKAAKGKGLFLYGNHTLVVGDAFHPNMVSSPRKAFVLTNPDATSIPGLKNIVAMLGAMPLPDGVKGYRNFLAAMKYRLSKKKVIMIYPEAHIWPYYTKIRPFKCDSFLYPVTINGGETPVYSMTTVLKKRRVRTLPKCLVYVDGPFYADTSLPVAEARQKLRDEVYNAMCERAKESDYDRVTYEKADVSEAEEGSPLIA